MKNYLRYAFIAVLAFIANMAFGQAYKTLTFPDDDKATNGIGAYDKTWTAKIGKDTGLLLTSTTTIGKTTGNG